MAGTTRIPLFPLGVVLFPTSQVPLHIFEERYKKLCEDSLRHHTAFGINYVEEDKLHSIGCTAQIADVIKRYPDGKLDVITEGIRRYEIVKFEQGGDKELSYATVRWIEDVTEERDKALADEAIALFNELCELAYKGTIDTLDPTIWRAADKLPSFAIAQKSGLEADQRQALLSITSENERLSILRNFLSQLLPRVREIETINDLIRNDGYIVTWNKKK
ncbi:MAG: LON peptidase substrate-binding domain-containing protein [Bacteroidota bacterium]|nr:LON peptidase substrate-binding domain-containing protein [Bacteroidota bacterium]MDP4230752.1 LON peptidase substrate-binding domain-containing protein [Bacteroidota bacterium]